VKRSGLSRQIDWQRLKGPLVLLGITLILFGGTLLWLHFDQARLDQRTATARQRLLQIQEQYRRDQESARLADQYREAYQTLVETDFLGDLDRITLVELLQRYRRERTIPLLTFRFEPERLLRDYEGLAPGLHRLQGSEQKLMFSLHDETELAGMLQLLKEAGRGMYLVESCELGRIDDRLHLAAPGNVRGQCILRWLSIEAAKEEDSDEI
jgi:hypothetical protein